MFQMNNFNLAYTGEKILHSDQKAYDVLDTTQIDFKNCTIKLAQKTGNILVRIAIKRETINTIPYSIVESHYTAKGGELIFINSQFNEMDAYVPRDIHGNPNGKQLLHENYKLIDGNLSSGAIYCPIAKPIKILHEYITQPTCIKNVWGVGNHQFLQEGATLKIESNPITGIDKIAFKETWKIIIYN